MYKLLAHGQLGKDSQPVLFTHDTYMYIPSSIASYILTLGLYKDQIGIYVHSSNWNWTSVLAVNHTVAGHLKYMFLVIGIRLNYQVLFALANGNGKLSPVTFPM